MQTYFVEVFVFRSTRFSLYNTNGGSRLHGAPGYNKCKKNFRFITTFITCIKQQKFNFIKSGPVDIIRKFYVLYPRTRVDEIKFLLFYTCDERWALHVVIKRKFFFTFITYNNGHYAVYGHSRSPIFLPIKSLYATSC